MKMDFFSAWISFLLILAVVEPLLPFKKKKKAKLSLSVLVTQ